MNPAFIRRRYESYRDEVELEKQAGPVYQNKKRIDAVQEATKNNANVAILDDGFQDSSIKKNLSIICFNEKQWIGNGLTIPSGPLREAVSEIKNYDAAFLNGEKSNKKLSKYLKKLNNDIKIFEAKYVPTNLGSFNLKNNFLFFCGLGNPSEFERTLKKYKFKIKEKIIFPDHYDFSDMDIFSIKKLAKTKKLNIITTEKDYLRLNKKNKKNVKFLKIDLNIKNMKNFSKFLIQRL